MRWISQFLYLAAVSFVVISIDQWLTHGQHLESAVVLLILVKCPFTISVPRCQLDSGY